MTTNPLFIIKPVTTVYERSRDGSHVQKVDTKDRYYYLGEDGYYHE